METSIKRVAAVWGTSERIGHRPSAAVYERALYRPRDGEEAHALLPHGGPGAGGPAAVPTAPDGLYILVRSVVGHYGHFIADVLSQMWPLVDRPDGPVWLLCESGHGQAFWRRHPFIGEMLAGLGLGYEAVVSFEGPVVLPRAVVAEPAFRGLCCVHEVFGDLCRRAGAPYWDPREVDTVARPAYLAKLRLTSGTLRLVNEGEVVDALSRLGVEIVYPEEMAFSAQVRLFSTRRVLLGVIGSAFHTAAFAAPNRRMIGLSSMQHLNSNTLMFDALNGTRSYYYQVPGTTHGQQDGFGLTWTIPDPRAVAAALHRRATLFDGIEALDRAQALREARRYRSLAGRTGRLRDRLVARLGRLLERPGAGG